ncbi:MAG: MarR family transcriptional regulator [Rhodobacteraceae bacterium]|nr:MarR family transcriptional regulator [Paracoccaceae bacterium]
MTNNLIARMRRFHRAVTTEAGLLDASFLGRGRPLGPARVLNAIGQNICNISDIRAYLRLDSGLASRLLRGLEAESLIELHTRDGDQRRRYATLTKSGKQEYAAYEALSDAQATGIISRYAQPDKLLDAMDIVAIALGFEQIRIERVSPLDKRAIDCLESYYDELNRRFELGFDVALSCDPEAPDMQHPRGAFFIALSDGIPIGCVGLKGTDKGYGEIKRLWTSPQARGLGLASQLMDAAEKAAKTLGVITLRLDSNKELSEAIAFYYKHGWSEIERFNDDPYPDIFMEKIL